MKNKYVNFVSDEHLLICISNLYKSYTKAKNDINKKKFYANKIDTIKLVFDEKFGTLNQEELIETEIFRQTDKSVNNAIGTFHEDVLGGIVGYEKGKLSGFDIKASDDSLFADIKNKHNTMNSSSAESLFQKLKQYADTYKKANCYWVQILAKSSFNERWIAEINGKEYSHSRVYKISGDQFYALLTKQDDAFFQLYKCLPVAIADFLASRPPGVASIGDSAIDEIKVECSASRRSILDQITFDNFGYYMGFDRL